MLGYKIRSHFSAQVLFHSPHLPAPSSSLTMTEQACRGVTRTCWAYTHTQQRLRRYAFPFPEEFPPVDEFGELVAASKHDTIWRSPCVVMCQHYDDNTVQMHFAHKGHHFELDDYYVTLEAGAGLGDYKTCRLQEAIFSFVGHALAEAVNRPLRKMKFEPYWSPVPFSADFEIVGYKVEVLVDKKWVEWAEMQRLETEATWTWADTKEIFTKAMVDQLPAYDSML
jgi:hypothetical protein